MHHQAKYRTQLQVKCNSCTWVAIYLLFREWVTQPATSHWRDTGN